MFRASGTLLKKKKKKKTQAAEVYIWVILFMRCTIYLFSTYKV